jgi:polar amino acid transport system permease protein
MGILALGLNVTAFNAEAYRAAIQAIPDAHNDAGIALGMTKLERIRHIILPQAARIATPVLITNAIGIFQQSALVSLISIEELMYQGRVIASESFRPIETLTTVALMYFAISFPVSQLVSWMEKRNARMTAR